MAAESLTTFSVGSVCAAASRAAAAVRVIAMVAATIVRRGMAVSVPTASRPRRSGASTARVAGTGECGQRRATSTCDNNAVSVPAQSGRFRFGLFEFDPASRELRREGALVRLQPQPAEVLALLVARAGEVVAREAL